MSELEKIDVEAVKANKAAMDKLNALETGFFERHPITIPVGAVGLTLALLVAVVKCS